jgi:hypothetical protein
VNALHQEVDLARLAEGVDEFLLDLVDVVEGKLFGRLWRRTEDLALWCALVEAFKTRGIDGLAHRFAAGTAETVVVALNPACDAGRRGNG